MNDFRKDIKLFIPKGEISFHRIINDLPRNRSFYVPAEVYDHYLEAIKELEKQKQALLRFAIDQGAYILRDRHVYEVDYLDDL